MHRTFTVEQILDAAARDLLPNTNYDFIGYEFNYDRYGERKPKMACVIGEAFLNLGLTENGITAGDLSHALMNVKPDVSPVVIKVSTRNEGWDRETFRNEFYNLSDFINELNSHPGWRGKKRITRLAKKYFSKSLQQEITI